MSDSTPPRREDPARAGVLVPSAAFPGQVRRPACPLATTSPGHLAHTYAI
ncbi:hypothetical protein ACFY3E_00240 [Streptomyces griseorubiginosus]